MVIALDNECVVCQNTRDRDGIAAGVDEDLYDHAAECGRGRGTARRSASPPSSRTLRQRHTGSADDEESGTAAMSSSPTNC